MFPNKHEIVEKTLRFGWYGWKVVDAQPNINVFSTIDKEMVDLVTLYQRWFDVDKQRLYSK